MLQFYLQLLDTEEEQRDFTLLYETYRKLMHWIAKRILYDEGLAEDAVQEAFLRIAKNFYKIKEILCPETRNFVVIIVRNVALTMRHQQTRDTEHCVYDAVQSETQHTAEDELHTILEQFSCGFDETADSLLVTGAVLNAEQVHQALRDYLLRRARELLEPLMKQTSAECGIPYGEVNFRLQQRRWGSCSGRKHISLNALLLFFPPEYVRYVMIHELCHTREMNHSANFWRLVATFCRDYKYLRSALNRESSNSDAEELIRSY